MHYRATFALPGSFCNGAELLSMVKVTTISVRGHATMDEVWPAVTKF